MKKSDVLVTSVEDKDAVQLNIKNLKDIVIEIPELINAQKVCKKDK